MQAVVALDRWTGRVDARRHALAAGNAAVEMCTVLVLLLKAGQRGCKAKSLGLPEPTRHAPAKPSLLPFVRVPPHGPTHGTTGAVYQRV